MKDFINKDMDISLAEKFNIGPGQYSNISVTELPFSIRVINRFRGNGIQTVGDMLSRTENELSKFRGFGANCLKEIEAYCIHLSQENDDSIAHSSFNMKPRVHALVSNNLSKLAVGDFSFVADYSLSEEEQANLDEIKEAYQTLGQDLVYDCINNKDSIVPLFEMFRDFEAKLAQHHNISSLISKIPSARKSKRLKPFIFAFTIDESHRTSLLKYVQQDDNDFYSLLRYDSFDESDFELLCDFLKWCKFDLQKDINDLLNTIFSNERGKTVIEMRSSKMTLEQIGNELGITRERVRQIENKVKSQFARRQSRSRIISKIYAERNGDTILTFSEIASMCDSDAQTLIYLLQSCENSSYTFDKQLEVFVVGNDSISSRMQAFIETMPDIVNSSQYDEFVQRAEDDEDIPPELFQKVFWDTYKKTGDVYHRSRLSLAKIYSNVLNEYYSNGIKAYDALEIQEFRERIKELYGEVSLPENDRALTARITSICILCDRGVYCPKKESYLSKELLNRIYKYIVDSNQPIFLTNTVFSVFEDELKTEGVNNKYYLQGILHEVFNEKFLFRRDYISKDTNVTSFYTSIVNFIKQSKYPVSKQQIQTHFPGITEIVINFAVSDSEILNYFGEYLHASHLQITGDERNKLYETTKQVVSDGNIHHIKDVFEIYKGTNFSVFSRNAAMFPFSAFSILEYLFRDDFEFSRPYIAKLGQQIERPADTLHEMIYCNDSFKISDISDFARENHFQIQSLLEYVLGCFDEYFIKDEDTLIRIEKTGITPETVKSTESILAEEVSDTKLINQLSIWHKLPKIECTWSEWLLFSAIKKWGTRFQVGTTNNQLRYALPIIAPNDRFDPDAFKNTVKNESSAIKIDNLDDIDALLENIIDEDILEESL